MTAWDGCRNRELAARLISFTHCAASLACSFGRGQPNQIGQHPIDEVLDQRCDVPAARVEGAVVFDNSTAIHQLNLLQNRGRRNMTNTNPHND
jgi:hypothetical protein